MQVNITGQNSGIIIVDVSTTLSLEVPRIEFELSNGQFNIIEIGTTTLTPTVKNNVSGFEFNQSSMEVDVLGQTQDSVYNTSTKNRTVLVRVDFSTSTITVFE